MAGLRPETSSATRGATMVQTAAKSAAEVTAPVVSTPRPLPTPTTGLAATPTAPSSPMTAARGAPDFTRGSSIRACDVVPGVVDTRSTVVPEWTGDPVVTRVITKRDDSSVLPGSTYSQVKL